MLQSGNSQLYRYIFDLRTLCHTIVICVVYSNLKHSSQPKNGFKSRTFSHDYFLQLEAPLRTSVYGWYGELNRGRRSLQDQSREGRPNSAVVSETMV